MVFASDWRSGDGGTNWVKMTNCIGVYTHDPATNTLYGKNSANDLVQSVDKGLTWTLVKNITDGIDDIAYDPTRSRFYIASGGRLKQLQGGVVTTLSTPADQFAGYRTSSVAVDPQNPDYVYAVSHKDIYS